MNVEQLQSYLGVGRSTAYKLLRTGEIGYFRIGSKIKIPKACVTAYLQESIELCYNDNSSGQVNPGCREGVYLV